MLLVGYNMGRRPGSEPWLLLALGLAGCRQSCVQRPWRVGKAARTVF